MQTSAQEMAMLRVICLIFLISSEISLIKGQCVKTYESGVSAYDEQIIVDKHNSLRLSLARGDVVGQPRACNMKRLQYDKQLGIEAQKIANTCTFQHVKVNDSRWWWVGQNLYLMSSTALTKGANWNSAIQSWFNEVKDYHYPDLSPGTGHYTQVIWANTSFVGCGFTSYENDNGYKYKKLYVCNYGLGGNIQGIPPYQTSSNGQCGCQNLC